MRINKWGKTVKQINYKDQWNWLILRALEDSQKKLTTEDIVIELEGYKAKWDINNPDHKSEFKRTISSHLAKMENEEILIRSDITDSVASTWSCIGNNLKLLVEASKIIAYSIDLNIVESIATIAWEEDFDFNMLNNEHVLRVLLLSTQDLRDILRYKQ